MVQLNDMHNSENEIFWSNCVIEALKRKFRNWDSIVLIPLLRFPFHFHMLWVDRFENRVFHFTHRSMEGWHSDMFFKGQVESMCMDEFKNWLITVGKENTIESI